jgi:hypothetical protein
MEADRLVTMSDDQVWTYLAPRLAPDNDWGRFLKGPAIERVRVVLVRRQDYLISELKRGDRALREEHVDKLRAQLRRVQSRMPMVNEALRAYHREKSVRENSERDRALFHALQLLTLQVVRHESVLAAAGVEPRAADVALWESLNWIKIPDGGGVASLAQVAEQRWLHVLQDGGDDD